MLKSPRKHRTYKYTVVSYINKSAILNNYTLHSQHWTSILTGTSRQAPGHHRHLTTSQAQGQHLEHLRIVLLKLANAQVKGAARRILSGRYLEILNYQEKTEERLNPKHHRNTHVQSTSIKTVLLGREVVSALTNFASNFKGEINTSGYETLYY